MKISQVEQCLKDLNFGPMTPWPKHLPAMAWSGQLLCGFEQPDGAVVELARQGTLAELADQLHAIYPKLTLAELARLRRCETLTPVATGLVSHLIELQGWRLTRDLERVLVALVETPAAFQIWTSRRELGVRDLQILNVVPTLSQVNPLLEELGRRQPSKSTGTQILETTIELMMIEGTPPHLPLAQQSDEAWYEHVKRRRHPETHQRDQQKIHHLVQLPWPAHVQTKWTRQGDEAGVEVRFTATSLLDYQRKIRGLAHVESRLSESLWKS
jgi:hypothetical protein